MKRKVPQEVLSIQSSMAATNSSLRGNVYSSSSGHRDMESAISEDSNGKDLVQGGVKRIEAVAKTWTKWGLITAYLGYEIDPLKPIVVALL